MITDTVNIDNQDIIELEGQNRESMAPFDYMMFAQSANNADACFPEITISQGSRYAFTRPTTSAISADIENYLTLEKPVGRAGSLFNPHPSMQEKEQELNLGQYSEFNGYINGSDSCKSLFANRHSLMTHPKDQYRSLSTQHLVFQPLLSNPQSVHYPTSTNLIGSNTRQTVIDSYKNRVCDKKHNLLEVHAQGSRDELDNEYAKRVSRQEERRKKDMQRFNQNSTR